jgi:hypothetical protein
MSDSDIDYEIEESDSSSDFSSDTSSYIDSDSESDSDTESKLEKPVENMNYHLYDNHYLYSGKKASIYKKIKKHINYFRTLIKKHKINIAFCRNSNFFHIVFDGYTCGKCGGIEKIEKITEKNKNIYLQGNYYIFWEPDHSTASMDYNAINIGYYNYTVCMSCSFFFLSIFDYVYDNKGFGSMAYKNCKQIIGKKKKRCKLITYELQDDFCKRHNEKFNMALNKMTSSMDIINIIKSYLF